MRKAPGVRSVQIVVFPGLQTLDAVGPAEAFWTAHRLRGDSQYEVELVASSRAPIRTGSGIELVPHRALPRRAADTLIIAGGQGVHDASKDERLLAWLRRTAPECRRVASVCTGAFVLARAGLLDGRRATTHWASCDRLQRRYPAVSVDPDPIFVKDGNVYTSAGVTAGIDLTLALIEEDLGPETALEVARWLVLFVQRPGGQAQFSAQLSGQLAERDSLRDLQRWIADHLDADLSVPALAERALMSPRNFARVFQREVGTTPAAYVESVRIERARLALESTPASVEEIARRCGFGTVETLRRTVARRLGVSPSAYRARFRSRHLEEAA